MKNVAEISSSLTAAQVEISSRLSAAQEQISSHLTAAHEISSRLTAAQEKFNAVAIARFRAQTDNYQDLHDVVNKLTPRLQQLETQAKQTAVRARIVARPPIVAPLFPDDSIDSSNNAFDLNNSGRKFP